MSHDWDVEKQQLFCTIVMYRNNTLTWCWLACCNWAFPCSICTWPSSTWLTMLSANEKATLLRIQNNDALIKNTNSTSLKKSNKENLLYPFDEVPLLMLAVRRATSADQFVQSSMHNVLLTNQK